MSVRWIRGLVENRVVAEVIRSVPIGADLFLYWRRANTRAARKETQRERDRNSQMLFLNMKNHFYIRGKGEGI